MASLSGSNSSVGDGDSSWVKDNSAVVGLEMQLPWSRHLLEGRKTIEVRSYNLPPELMGRQMFILESQSGTDGVSALGDKIELTSCSDEGDPSPCQIRGWCIFESVKNYTSQVDFQADEAYHLVSPDSGYAWNEPTTKNLYGWCVKECHFLDDKQSAIEADQYNVALRWKRSIFKLYKKES